MVAHADAVLRIGSVVAGLIPEVVVSLGAPPASKVLTAWMARCCDPTGPLGSAAADRVLVNRAGSWWDADRLASLVVAASPGALARAVLAALPAPRPGPKALQHGTAGPGTGGSEPLRGRHAEGAWWACWRRADDLAELALEAALGGQGVAADHSGAASGAAAGVSEPALARAVYAGAHRRGAVLMVSSSMPVRDLEWFAPRLGQLDGSPPTPVLANRGANGIDGVVATAAGAALASDPQEVWLLIGDLALLHDAGALLGLVERPLRLRIVVADNRGGGIFSFLPQAHLVEPERFEQLFGTPAPLDPAELLRLHRADTRVLDESGRDPIVGSLSEALEDLGASVAPVAALVVRCPDRSDNVAIHGALNAAVAEALGELG